MDSMLRLSVLLVGSIAILFFGMFLNGWVISILWNWFLVPLDVMPIGILHACGLVMLVRLLVIDKGLSFTQTKNTPIKNQFVISLTPLIVLLVGYVVHLYM